MNKTISWDEHRVLLIVGGRKVDSSVIKDLCEKMPCSKATARSRVKVLISDGKLTYSEDYKNRSERLKNIRWNEQKALETIGNEIVDSAMIQKLCFLFSLPKRDVIVHVNKLDKLNKILLSEEVKIKPRPREKRNSQIVSKIEVLSNSEKLTPNTWDRRQKWDTARAISHINARPITKEIINELAALFGMKASSVENKIGILKKNNQLYSAAEVPSPTPNVPAEISEIDKYTQAIIHLSDMAKRTITAEKTIELLQKDNKDKIDKIVKVYESQIQELKSKIAENSKTILALQNKVSTLDGTNIQLRAIRGNVFVTHGD